MNKYRIQILAEDCKRRVANIPIHIIINDVANSKIIQCPCVDIEIASFCSEYFQPL